MSEPRPQPGDQPPPATRRLLDRPPSSRFETPSADPDEKRARRRREARRWLVAGIAALLAAAATVLLVGGLATVSGLLFVTGASGLVIGSQLAPRPAISLTLAGIFAGDTGAWLVARAEGGVLDLPAYALEIFGLGLVGQVLVGALAARYASVSIRGSK